ncbi:diguanylate cyclase domain-containing protein [Fredinandcohnia humi]
MKVKAVLLYPIFVIILGVLFLLLKPYTNGGNLLLISFLIVFIYSLLAGRRIDRLRKIHNKTKNDYMIGHSRKDGAINGMLDLSIDLVYIIEVKNEELYITSVNKSFLKMFGLSKRKVIGSKVVELLNSEIADKCLQVIEKQSSVDFLSNVSFPLEQTHLDTSIFPFEYLNGKPRYLVCVSKIISGRKQAEELVKETENHFQFITENATDIIVKLASDSTFLYVSPIIEKIIGVKPKDILYEYSLFDLIHPDDHKQCLDFFEKMQQSDEISAVSYRAIRVDGSIIWLESTGKRIQQEGEMEFICITRDATERKVLEERIREANQRLEYLSYVDELTKVGNRRKFDLALKKEGQKAISLTVLMFDIDCFKEYNDLYGHVLGDSCLISVANIVQSTVNECNAEVFRYGGEEFIVLYPESSNDEAVRLGKQIIDAVCSLKIPHQSSSVSNVVTVSVGLVTIEKSENIFDPYNIIDYADKALYSAKNAGKNQVRVYEEKAIII